MKQSVLIFLFLCNACFSGIPEFSGRNAFEYLEAQCGFGPRNPGSKGHYACRDYLIKELTSSADTVWRQPFRLPLKGSDVEIEFTNIIARFRPEAERQILLGAHWDTRPWADQDSDKEKRLSPIIGANDGASGVAVLLELARLLQKIPPPIGVTIVLFDGEDIGTSGQPYTYARGSQYFARNLPFPRPEYAIVLDMVGDADLYLPIERNSFRQDRDLVKSLWRLADQLELPAFESTIRHTVYDDHVPLFELAGIPAVDIIDFDYPNQYTNYWHTHQDLPENCSPSSLEQVGTLLVHHIYGIK